MEYSIPLTFFVYLIDSKDRLSSKLEPSIGLYAMITEVTSTFSGKQIDLPTCVSMELWAPNTIALQHITGIETRLVR